MTSDLTTSETEPRAVTRIGPPLLLASVLGSTLGIVIAQFLDNFGTGLLAEILGGDAVVYNNRVVFTGADEVAWAGGFILCLIVGLFALFAYPTQRGHGVSRLVLLWTLLHVLRQALEQAALLPLSTDSPLALAYGTFDAPPGLEMVIAAAGGIGLLLIALAAAAAFLAFTPHRTLVSSGRKRLTFVLWVTLIPAVASVPLALPFFSSDVAGDVVSGLPLTALMFLATLAAAPGTTTVHGPDTKRETPWPWGLVAMLIVLLVFHLGVLQGGVSVDPRLWG